MLRESFARPDILVVEPNVSPVAIEVEILPAINIESEALSRLGQYTSGAGRTILSAIAVRLPTRIRAKQGHQLVKELAAAADLEMALYTGSDSSKASRWPRSVGKDNLTLSRLAGTIEDATLATRVAALVESAKAEAGFVRDWRNRHLAHRDLQLALGSGAQPLSTVSDDQMERALAALRSVMNEIQLHYWNSTTEYEFFVAPNDAESLTYYLSEAVKAERKQQERWSGG